jgi:hypothetical protein
MTRFPNRYFVVAFCAAILASGAAPDAEADTIYAFAENLLTDFQIQSALGTITDVSGTRTTINSAQYGALTDSTQDPEVIPAGSDAPEATAGPGPFPGENTFAAFEGLGILNGSRGDSFTAGADPFTGNGGTGVPAVYNVAEAEVVGDPGSLGASAAGGNEANATYTFSVTVPTTITFSFNDDISLMAATSGPGDSANASVANSFEIAELDGTQVFLYTPTTCGTGNLQGSVGSTGAVPPESIVTATCSVNGTSPLLAPGSYEVSLRSASEVSVQSPGLPTPEPATTAFLGIGLVCLFLIRARRSTSI